ncbi:MAG: SDR family oxidoreductase [Bacteroidales bacterium]|nr:SDR family oxidoreductase [Bacteroidales bacterium]
MKKVIFITGISSGFGKSTAELLAEKGYIVYGTSRKHFETDSRITLLHLNISDQAAVNKAVYEVVRKEQKIDVLINNAGMGIAGPVETTSADEIKMQMESNFYGVVHTIQAVLPFMRKQNGGLIINISSIGGLMGLPYQGFYASSKFAVEGLSESLRMELKPFGIQIVLVNPGDFNTNFTASRKINNTDLENPYTAQFKKTLSVIENDENSGLQPLILARKIYAIIKKDHPKYRYIVASFDQKLAVFLKYLLPDTWFFKILQHHYKIK